MLKSLTPNLMVHDVNQTLAYYKKNFGAEVRNTVPEEGTLTWAMIKIDDVMLMFQSTQSLEEDISILQGLKPGGGLTFFVQMTGVQALHDRIKDDVEIVDAMRETFYGMKEFTIRDLNGYFLTFAEPIE